MSTHENAADGQDPDGTGQESAGRASDGHESTRPAVGGEASGESSERSADGSDQQPGDTKLGHGAADDDQPIANLE